MSQSRLNVAIIMDGNGRWATRRGLPRFAGHQAGAETLRRIVEAAPACGIGALTVYAFSADNWRRPEAEVSLLMTLLASYLASEQLRLAANGVRVSAIGRRDRLPHELANAIRNCETATAGGDRLHLRLAIDYSAREAIQRAGTNLYEELGEPVDLLIRTGGEQRLSDFLLWECAYAELFFSPRMWPEFDGIDLRQIVREFWRRERRFGGLPGLPQPAAPVAERWLR